MSSITPEERDSVLKEVMETAENAGKIENFEKGKIANVDLKQISNKIAKVMSAEESDYFTDDGEDIGCIKHLRMKIDLEDGTPV